MRRGIDVCPRYANEHKEPNVDLTPIFAEASMNFRETLLFNASFCIAFYLFFLYLFHLASVLCFVCPAISRLAKLTIPTRRSFSNFN